MARRATAAEKLEAIREVSEGFPQDAWDFFRDRAHSFTRQTMMAYAYDLRVFFRWLSDRLNKSPDQFVWNTDIDYRVVREFFRHLKDYDSKDRFGKSVDRSNTLKGEARKFSALSSFFEYLVIESLMRENPVASKERRRQIIGRNKLSATKDLPVYLNKDEASQLLQSVHTYEGRDHGASKERDHALLALLLFTGIRASELINLSKSSIEYESTRDPGRPLRAVIRVVGKGEKTRIIGLHPAVERLIQAYLQARPEQEVTPEHQDALFLNRWLKRINRHTVWEVVTKYARHAGLPPKAKRISPHKLRHSFATMLLVKGDVNVRELQDLLGHASINTTMIYTHVADERRRRIMETHPLGEELL